MSQLIEPRLLKGFRDYPPALMIPREQLLEKARQVYRSYGFAPIDTPALEYAEILVGKMDCDAEMQRQLYRFCDQGGRDVALRFDLTVPFARFAAQHVGQLGTPFKRYHLATVWRGEAPQAGRFREFMQCDFDTIGTTSNAADVETALVIHDLMRALGFERFEVRVNNRLILNGFLEQWVLSGLAPASILRALDKLPKIGREAVREELVKDVQIKPEQADSILSLAFMQGSNQEILDLLDTVYNFTDKMKEGTARLRELVNVWRQAGLPEDRLRIDLSIARGLDYYTGTIYETFLLDLPRIGSVCSGGRYDNLAGLYTRQHLPGVGASLGLDRLLAAMEELQLLPKTSTPAPVLVVQFDAARLGDYQRLARMLRGEGIGVEVYPDAKKLGQQLKYAEGRGFRVALIAGENEFAQGVWQVKNLATRQQTTVLEADVSATVRAALGV